MCEILWNENIRVIWDCVRVQETDLSGFQVSLAADALNFPCLGKQSVDLAKLRNLFLCRAGWQQDFSYASFHWVICRVQKGSAYFLVSCTGKLTRKFLFWTPLFSKEAHQVLFVALDSVIWRWIQYFKKWEDGKQQWDSFVGSSLASLRILPVVLVYVEI